MEIRKMIIKIKFMKSDSIGADKGIMVGPNHMFLIKVCFNRLKVVCCIFESYNDSFIRFHQLSFISFFKQCYNFIINVCMLETIDYRNLRYQGEMQNDRPHGVGIAYDVDQLFCLAEWRDGRIHGATFVIFPDSRIFCGRIEDENMVGLCAFYLQDQIQIYVNYKQKAAQEKGFIAVLPFFKVILEVENGQSTPKANRHVTYEVNDSSLERKLHTFIGERFELSEFRSWKEFLHLNFVKMYPKRLYWKKSYEGDAEIVFLGLKWQGLGVKIIMHDEKNALFYDGDFFIVTEMGNFTSLHTLQGYGKKIIEHSKYKMQQEGIFGEIEDLIQYPRKCQDNKEKDKGKNRPKECKKTYNKQLKTSIFFNNSFLNLKFLKNLQDSYSNINVLLVQETKKVAQIVIQQNDDSVVLAEIQNKKHRKTTPQKNSEKDIDSDYQRVKDIDERSGRKASELMTPYSETMTVNPQTKKAIYSSVQKKRLNKNSPGRERKYTNDFPSSPQPTEFYKQLKQSPSKPTFPLSKEYSHQYEKSPTIQRASATKKYLYQTILEDPSYLKKFTNTSAERINHKYEEKYTKSPIKDKVKQEFYVPNFRSNGETTVKKQNNPRTSYDYVEQPRKNPVNIHNKERAPMQQQRYRPKQQRQQRQQRQPPIRKYNSKEDEDLINFFNKKIEEENPGYSDLNRGFFNQQSMSSNGIARSITPKREKTPGKIITYKKRTNPHESSELI